MKGTIHKSQVVAVYFIKKEVVMGKTAQQKKDTNWKISQAQEKNWKDGKYKNRKVSKIDEVERFLTDKLVEKYGILIKKESLEDTESQIFELLKYLYEHRQEKK